MNFNSGRVALDPQPQRQQRVALEVVILGHCPGGVDVEYLFSSPQMVAGIEGLGYADSLEVLRQSPLPRQPFYGVPLPVRSLSQFQSLFPAVQRVGKERYISRLAGDQVWLPSAVEDFFMDSSNAVNRKLLWVISVDETQGQQAFLPAERDDFLDLSNSSAFTRALAIPRVGLLIMPDLERLQIPSALADIPRLRLANPPPDFLPCGEKFDDTHRERRNSHEINRQPTPHDFGEILPKMLRTLSKWRPDIQLLFALPFDLEQRAERPQPSASALHAIAQMRNSTLAPQLHRVQLTYPYLRSARRSLISSSALLAGAMASTTAELGSWRSVAGKALAGEYQPYPLLPQYDAARLRDEAGIGTLVSHRSKLELSDERLPGGVFGESAEYARSGEIARFIGWLRRELEGLGLQLLFEVDPLDPRPMMLLRDFFTRLHQRGALRGRLPEEAFAIRQSNDGESTLLFEIEIAPAFPIDRIRLVLAQDRLEIARG